MRSHGNGHYSPIEETLIGITPGPGPSGSGTALTIASGQTTTLQPSTQVVRFDTSGGTTATADMIQPTPSDVGRRWTFYWWAWNVAQVPPTINAPAGKLMVPFTGQAASGSAGLVSTTTIATPGASFTLEWDGTEFASV